MLLCTALCSACGSSASRTSTSSSRSAATATGSAETTAGAGARAGAEPNGSQPGAGRIGPEGIPLEAGPPLAPASTTAPGTTVDGIHCAPVEQLVYHIHVHLQVYVDGQPRELPPAIGMVDPVAQQTPNGPFYGAQGCYYWLHVHTGDGVIHVESPLARIYTLGDFFDEWRQPLSPARVARASGLVTAYLNGTRWTKSPRDIPLVPHALIQLDVGAPVVPFRDHVSWARSGL